MRRRIGLWTAAFSMWSIVGAAALLVMGASEAAAAWRVELVGSTVFPPDTPGTVSEVHSEQMANGFSAFIVAESDFDYFFLNPPPELLELPPDDPRRRPHNVSTSAAWRLYTDEPMALSILSIGGSNYGVYGNQGTSTIVIGGHYQFPSNYSTLNGCPSDARGPEIPVDHNCPPIILPPGEMIVQMSAGYLAPVHFGDPGGDRVNRQYLFLTPVAIPEPATLSILLMGLCSILAAWRMRAACRRRVRHVA